MRRQGDGAMKLPLESITVSKRRRDDYGDIDGLAESIRKYGLLHPVVIDDEGTLVAGERRLRAVQALGWESVDVRDIGELSAAERAEIELEENLQRKDLTTHERSKILVKLAETAKAVLQEQAETCTDSVQVSKGLRGPARQPDSSRAVSERLGVPAQTIREAQQHVETVEQHPELGGPNWKQYHVLEAREKLERIPEPERAKAVALVSQRDILPRDATGMLSNLAEMPAPERERVLTLAESEDTRDRDLAVTEAAKKPAMPDQRMHHLIDVVATLGQAERMYPGDALNDRFTALRNSAKDLLVTVKEYRRDA